MFLLTLYNIFCDLMLVRIDPILTINFELVQKTPSGFGRNPRVRDRIVDGERACAVARRIVDEDVELGRAGGQDVPLAVVDQVGDVEQKDKFLELFILDFKELLVDRQLLAIPSISVAVSKCCKTEKSLKIMDYYYTVS